MLAKSRVTIDTVTTLDGVAALRPCYEHLNRVTGNTLPFALHEWHLAWCRHFLNGSAGIHDEPHFYVLRESAGACVAILPFILSRRRAGPLRIVSINMLGADPGITEIRSPLIDPGYEHLIAHAVQDQLARVGGWDWIHWSGISDGFAAALAAGGRLQSHTALLDFVLDMPPTWEEFRRGLKRNIRESLRHCYNSLKRDNHCFELQVIEDPLDLHQALDRFLALHIMRADLKTAVMHPNRFASRVCRDFLYEICERLAERGALRIFQLVVGSQVVAMRIGFVAGDSLYLYYSGFNPEWSRYSVMTTTVAEAIKYAITHGLKTVNLSPNLDVSKSRWGPRQVDYKSVYEPGWRLHSRLARHAYSKAKSANGAPSRLLQRLFHARRTWL